VCDGGARGDILLVLMDVVTVTDVSVIHPQGVASYGTLEPHGYPFVPFSVET
jgi:hypothetical protein